MKRGPKPQVGEQKLIPVRIPPKMYNMLRKLAYLREAHMSELVREAIYAKLEIEKKLLHNSDIVV